MSDIEISKEPESAKPAMPPKAQRAQTRGVLQRVLGGQKVMSDIEISKEVFMQEAIALDIPQVVAARLFDEFDLDGNQKVSLSEIDKATESTCVKRNQNYVDTNLLKVNLPILALEDTGPSSPVSDTERMYWR